MASAAGLLTLLEEPNDTLKQYALENLDKVVHDSWFQISPSIASVEALYEDEGFKNRELAALIASKVGAARDRRGRALGAARCPSRRAPHGPGAGGGALGRAPSVLQAA
jgi:26S proteasome regulatory subunit N2